VLYPPRGLAPRVRAPLGLVAGLAAAGFGLYLMSITDLMKQNQLYYYTSQKEQDVHYAKRICTYSDDFFMTAFFILKARGISTTVLVAGGGLTPADCMVPATAMVTVPVEVVDGSVPTSWRLGSGEEADGLQKRQC
jgi:hypothetical protein